MINPYCHRGIPLRVRLDLEENSFTRTCLCPSSYYGDRCQYQNERVSLILQLNTTSYSQYTSFILVISLIDDSIQRIIHSYQQFTYFHIKDHIRNLILIYFIQFDQNISIKNMQYILIFMKECLYIIEEVY
jgi:hypothetical protein